MLSRQHGSELRHSTFIQTGSGEDCRSKADRSGSRCCNHTLPDNSRWTLAITCATSITCSVFRQKISIVGCMGGRIKDTGPCKGQTAAAYACHRTSGGMIRLQKLPDVRRIGRCPDATAYHDKHIRCPSDNLIQSMRNHGLQPALRTDNSSLGGEKTDIKAVKGYSRSGDKRVFPVCESLRQYKRNLCQLQPPSLSCKTGSSRLQTAVGLRVACKQRRTNTLKPVRDVQGVRSIRRPSRA